MNYQMLIEASPTILLLYLIKNTNNSARNKGRYATSHLDLRLYLLFCVITIDYQIRFKTISN